MTRIGKWLIVLAVAIGSIVLVESLWGSGPAAVAGTLIAVSLGTGIGVRWGNKQAAATDEYRQKWLSGRRLDQTRHAGDGDEEANDRL